MDRFFSVFGKLALALIILGLVAFASFNLGKTKTGNNRVIDYSEIVTNQTPTAQVSETAPSETPKKTILGGVDKSAGLAFFQYSLKTSIEWNETSEAQTSADETLILKKGGYEISIFQAATGGAVCLYPGDPDFEGPSSRYGIFKDLQTNDNLALRRSGDAGDTNYTVCQKNSEGDYGAPTSYGHISLKLPAGFDPKTLTEIDEILSSLQKR